MARRLKRSKVALGAAAALVLVVAVAAATEVRAAYLDAQYREWLEITPSFPPNFTILKHENRVYVHEQDRADVEALLDRAAAACVDPLPTYLLRASFRLDHGDPRGAAEDMAVIARHEGTRFARALARAYAAVPEDSAGSKAVDLSEVPEPVTARERYLRAYHYLREFSDAADADAGELLDAEVCAGIPHAEELRFALVLLDAMEPEQAHPEAIRLYTDVRRFEERIGVETATTQHYLGYALLNLNRFAESLRYCRKSVELAPRTHVNRTNAAYAAFVRGEIDEVRVHVGIAADVRPNDEKPAKTLIWTYIREYEFDEALAAVETAAPRFEPRSPGWSVEWRGLVETYRALAIWSELSKLEGDAADERRDELAATLDLAREHLDAAEAAGIQRPAEDAARIVEALGEGDESAAFEVLVRRYLLDVSRWWRLELVERHLPEDLDARSTRAIGDFITLIRREISSASDSVSSDR